ncbi:MAG TPA: maltose alpha-D-glucosyltransferase, partial [Gammaproteobacteria bacterium]|nr:maltose alpha-D-glucosyltransferase [Gammaproteobacteria bacterium]
MTEVSDPEAVSKIQPQSETAHWYKDAVIYELHVRAFFDSNGDGIGDFAGATEKLDYLKDLGVTAIWLLPFYPSPLQDDGYDIADYTDVHPSYGSLRDVRTFIREAHKRGLKVITELVCNHTSDQHAWFQRSRRAAPGSSHRNFYVWSDTPEKYRGTRIIFKDFEQSNWAWDSGANAYYWHRFYAHQPDLNFDNPRVKDAIMRVMDFWLDMGVDGLRLDAIPYLYEREGTSCENLPQTYEFLRELRSHIDANFEERMLLAEANQWPEDVREYFANGDECHMAYHFPLMPRMYMAIAQEDRYPIVEILGQTPEIPPTCQWAIFLRNHDELTLEMVTDRERDYMYQAYAMDPRTRVNGGIRRRLAPLMDNDTHTIQLMNSLLLSMPGSPSVYYGDELGMGDNIYLGDRNSVRTPMQWSPDRNGGFSRSDPQALLLPPIMDPIYGYASVNVEAQSREPASLLNWMRRILAVRKGYKAFGRGTFELLRPGNRAILAYVRRYENEVLLCVANLKRSAQPVELDLAAFRGRVPVELLGRAPFPPIGELPYLLTLPGHAFYWFELAESASVPSWHEQRLVPEQRPWIVLFDGLTSFDAAGPRPDDARRLLTQLETELVPAYLGAQHWFDAGVLAKPAAAVTIGCEWSTRRGGWLLARAAVEPAAGGPREYFLPLAIEWGPERAGPPAAHTVARVRQRSQTGLLSDAFAHPDFARDLLDALARGETVQCGSDALVFTATSTLPELMPSDLDAAAVRRPAGDAADVAVLVGPRLFVKALRRLERGAHPAWEMGRFLTERSPCKAVVPTAGVVELQTDAGAPRAAIALVQAAAAHQGDGLRYTRDYLARVIDDAILRSADGAPLAADHASYLLRVERLAERTAELHRALAVTTGDPAFDPEPLDVHAWTAQVRAAVDAALDALRDAADPSPPAARAAEPKEPAARFAERRGAWHAWLGELEAPPSPRSSAVATRVHGDYRLERVLIVKNDLAITGFGGDATRPLAERRAKRSPAADVAAMLRSFDRVKASAAREQAAKGHAKTADVERLLEDWREQVHAVFLERYREAMADCPAWPADEREARRLLDLAAAERLLAEIEALPP